MQEKVSFGTKLSFGYGAFGKDLSLAIVNVFLFFYLTEVAKIAPETLGIIFLFAKIWDIVDDPIWGYIIASTRSRFGKYKPWIFFGNIFNCIFMVACFSTHLFEGTTQLIYLTIVYILWGIACTVSDAPFWSLIPSITLDKGEREGLMPYPRMAATLGYYIATGCGVYAVHLFGQGDDGKGYLIYALIGGLLAVSSALVTCKWTEQNFDENQNNKADEISIKDAFAAVFQNSQLLIFLVMSICYILGCSMCGSVQLYFYKYALGDESLYSTMSFFGPFAAIPSLLLFKPILNFCGRKLIFCLALLAPLCSALCVTFAAWGLVPTYPMVIAAGLLSGFSMGIYWSIVMIMIADTVDYGVLKFNHRCESIYYSMHTTINKICWAVSASLAGFLLAAINYDPKVTPTQETIDSLINIYWGSNLLSVLALLLYLTCYRLNGKVLDDMQTKLKASLQG